MPDDNELVARVKAYFARQTAWFEDVLAEFESLDPRLASADLAQLVTRHAHRATETSGFDAESRDLLAQWHAAENIRPEDREAVRQSARRAQVLGQELQARYDAAGKAAHQRMDDVKVALDALGRGRGFLKKYRTEDGDASGGMVDRNG